MLIYLGFLFLSRDITTTATLIKETFNHMAYSLEDQCIVITVGHGGVQVAMVLEKQMRALSCSSISLSRDYRK